MIRRIKIYLFYYWIDLAWITWLDWPWCIHFHSMLKMEVPASPEKVELIELNYDSEISTWFIKLIS